MFSGIYNVNTKHVHIRTHEYSLRKHNVFQRRRDITEQNILTKN